MHEHSEPSVIKLFSQSRKIMLNAMIGLRNKIDEFQTGIFLFSAARCLDRTFSILCKLERICFPISRSKYYFVRYSVGCAEEIKLSITENTWTYTFLMYGLIINQCNKNRKLLKEFEREKGTNDSFFFQKVISYKACRVFQQDRDMFHIERNKNIFVKSS